MSSSVPTYRVVSAPTLSCLNTTRWLTSDAARGACLSIDGVGAKPKALTQSQTLPPTRRTPTVANTSIGRARYFQMQKGDSRPRFLLVLLPILLRQTREPVVGRERWGCCRASRTSAAAAFAHSFAASICDSVIWDAACCMALGTGAPLARTTQFQSESAAIACDSDRSALAFASEESHLVGKQIQRYYKKIA